MCGINRGYAIDDINKMQEDISKVPIPPLKDAPAPKPKPDRMKLIIEEFQKPGKIQELVLKTAYIVMGAYVLRALLGIFFNIQI